MTEDDTGAARAVDDNSSGAVLAMYAAARETPDYYSIPRTVPHDHAAA